jgi:hypothetical protein
VKREATLNHERNAQRSMALGRIKLLADVLALESPQALRAVGERFDCIVLLDDGAFDAWATACSFARMAQRHYRELMEEVQ